MVVLGVYLKISRLLLLINCGFRGILVDFEAFTVGFMCFDGDFRGVYKYSEAFIVGFMGFDGGFTGAQIEFGYFCNMCYNTIPTSMQENVYKLFIV